MSTRIEALERVSAALAEFGELASGEAGQAVVDSYLHLSDTDLLEAVARMGRVVQAAHTSLTELVAEVEHRSPAARGDRSLCKREGFASTTALVSTITGLSGAAVARFTRVGSAIHRSRDLSGNLYSARRPALAAALSAGTLTVDAADLIHTALTKARRGASLAQLESAERTLVAMAGEHPLTELAQICAHATDVIDPDGIRPREERQLEDRSLTITQQSDGMTKLVWLLPAVMAPIVTGGIITMARLADNGPAPEAARIDAAFLGGINANSVADRAAEDPNLDGCTPAGASYDQYGRPLGVAAQIWARKLSDAALAFFEHAARCKDTGEGSVPTVQMVVRISLDALTGAADGAASIDGGGTISAGHARRLAAKAGIIPAVLGTGSDLLDQGREKRLFTKKQKIALMERDGACCWPGCGTRPGWTDAHHIDWWKEDHGETNIDNGAMLCSSHHHRIHDNGWRIEVRPPDSDPNGPPVPHFIAPVGATSAHLIPGAIVHEYSGQTTLVGGRGSFSTSARASANASGHAA